MYFDWTRFVCIDCHIGTLLGECRGQFIVYGCTLGIAAIHMRLESMICESIVKGMISYVDLNSQTLIITSPEVTVI